MNILSQLLHISHLNYNKIYLITEHFPVIFWTPLYQNTQLYWSFTEFAMPVI